MRINLSALTPSWPEAGGVAPFRFLQRYRLLQWALFYLPFSMLRFSRFTVFSDFSAVSEDDQLGGNGKPVSSTVAGCALSCFKQHSFLFAAHAARWTPATGQVGNGQPTLCFTIAFMSVSSLDYRSKQINIVWSAALPLDIGHDCF